MMDLVDLPTGQVDPRLEPYNSWILVAPDHIESRTGRLLHRATAKSQNAISGKYAFSAGDVLYSKIRPYLRKAVLANFDGLCSADVYPLRPRQDVHPSYLLALILSEPFSAFAESVSMRSGFPKINRNELAEYRAAVPPLTEQARIAEVLDTLDEAIRRAEVFLGKRQAIVTGLVQQLFSGRGEAARLPSGWRLEELGDLCDRITDGTHQAVRTTPEGLPFLFVSCIRDGQIHWDQAARIPQRTYNLISPGRVPVPEAVLYTAVGSYGHAAVVETSEPFGFQRHIAILYPGTKSLSPLYLAEWLNSEGGRKIADKAAIGNAQKTVTLGALGRFPIPVPGDAAVQEALVAPIRAARAELLHLDRELLKLHSIKSGLSSDLLTGRVRVTTGAPA